MNIEIKDGNIYVPIDHIELERVIAKELTSLADYYDDCLERYKTDDKCFIAIFSTDRKEDIKRLKKMTKSLRRVAKHYRGQDD